MPSADGIRDVQHIEFVSVFCTSSRTYIRTQALVVQWSWKRGQGIVGSATCVINLSIMGPGGKLCTQWLQDPGGIASWVMGEIDHTGSWPTMAPDPSFQTHDYQSLGLIYGPERCKKTHNSICWTIPNASCRWHITSLYIPLSMLTTTALSKKSPKWTT